MSTMIFSAIGPRESYTNINNVEESFSDILISNSYPPAELGTDNWECFVLLTHFSAIIAFQAIKLVFCLRVLKFSFDSLIAARNFIISCWLDIDSADPVVLSLFDARGMAGMEEVADW